MKSDSQNTYTSRPADMQISLLATIVENEAEYFEMSEVFAVSQLNDRITKNGSKAKFTDSERAMIMDITENFFSRRLAFQ